jgi:Tfp pilus assembly protein PilF
VLIDVGRPNEALVHLHQAVAQDPGDSRAQCLIAVAHLKLDQPGDALKAAAASATLDPEDAWPQRLMAIAFGELGKTRKAKAAAVEACRLDPQEPMAHIVLSGALQASGDEAGALAAARHAIELHPALADAYNQVGIVLLAQDRLAEAEAAFRAALAIDAEHPKALNNLAVVHLKMKRRDEALDEFEKAAKLDPSSQIARRNVLVVGGAHMKRRLAIAFAIIGVPALVAGQFIVAAVLLGIAAASELLRRASLKELDEATRTLVHDDERARRFHPLRWEWRWVTRLRPWWWLLIREVTKQIPASLLFGINIGALALAGIAQNGEWAIILAVALLFTSRRFYRLWRRKHPPRGSWRPEDFG